MDLHGKPSRFERIWRRFPNYALVGAVATGAHYALLIFLREGYGVPAATAAMLGAILGAMVSYVGNRRLTFPGSRTSHRVALPRFLVVAVMSVAMNGVIVGTLVRYLGVHYMIAQCVATAAVLILSYHLNRLWTFT